ncbi:MAG: antibiotic biosynthesis monooxygenase [Acidobacteriota bacterium]
MKFIFEIRIKSGHTVDEYVAAWSRGSAIIQRAPGARGTRLHRKIDEPNTLLAIASWDSKASRDASEAYLRPDDAMKAILDAHSQYADFTVLGAFEDPEWVVEPHP